MQLNLKGKVAMVAASSKGLGFGTVQESAREGDRVSIASRSQAAIDSVALQLCQETNAQVLGTLMDALGKASIKSWPQRNLENFGWIDCFLVNAGGLPPGRFVDFPNEVWRAAFEMNLMSAVRMIRGVISSQSCGGGSNLTVASSSERKPINVLILLNVMRYVVISLVKSLSLKLTPMKIRVNNLMPGRIDTNRVRTIDESHARFAGISVGERKAKSQATIPLQRYGTIEDFCKMGAFLLSNAGPTPWAPALPSMRVP